jgi:hypothetical protein
MIFFQVLTVNQVFDIMLNFIATREWKSAFFKVIPLRKRDDTEAETLCEERDAIGDVVAVTEDGEKEGLEGDVVEEGCVTKKQCIRETEDGENIASVV